jgi:hypothetical protein
MVAIRFAAIAAIALPALAHAQVDPNDIPEPPTAELMRLQPFLGSYGVTGTYFDQEWAGSLDLRPVVKGWFVEWEINVHSGPIDRQLRMLITWDRQTEEYRIWRFETSPPAPRDQVEGTGRFEGGDFVMEWKMPTPDGAPGVFRNRLRLEGSDKLVIVSEGERANGQGGVVRIGVTTARRRL